MYAIEEILLDSISYIFYKTICFNLKFALTNPNSALWQIASIRGNSISQEVCVCLYPFILSLFFTQYSQLYMEHRTYSSGRQLVNSLVDFNERIK